MYKIAHYKVPVTLTRTPDGEVSLDIKDTEKELKHTETLEKFNPNEVPKLSKELSDYNEKQKEILKNSLLQSQLSEESHLVFKYLE